MIYLSNLLFKLNKQKYQIKYFKTIDQLSDIPFCSAID